MEKKLKEVRACIFAPDGTYFAPCKNCGSPSIQYFDQPMDNCIWCDIEGLEEAEVEQL